jgi:RNA polymerase sigma factor (sigma-70 family)
MTRISIVEDQKDVANNIVKMINATPNMSAVGVYYSAEDALAMLPADRADIVLMDIVLPGMNGLECMVRLKDLAPDLTFLMFTAFDDDPLLFDALRFGASGYILKEERFFGIMRAINAHLKGEVPISPRIAHKILTFFQNQELATSSKKKIKTGDRALDQLTPRQNEIVSLVAKGLTDKEVADRLGITNGTCRRHVSDCLQRLQLANRTELALRWKELND